MTCGSRLKVLDPRLIGSIANCPKCGAMVEITAGATGRSAEGSAPPPVTLPQQSQPLPTGSAPVPGPSTSIGGAIDDSSRPPSPVPHPPSTDLPAPPIRSPHRDRPQLAVGSDTGIDSEALTQSAVASPQELGGAAMGESGGAGFEPGMPDLGTRAALPADPAQVWQSESSRRVSQFGLVLTLGLFGLIAATVAFVQFARSWSDSAKPSLAAADPDAAPHDSAEPAPVDAPTAADGSPPSTGPGETPPTESAAAATAEPAEVEDQAGDEAAGPLTGDASTGTQAGGTGAADSRAAASPGREASPGRDAAPPAAVDPPVVLTPEAQAPTGIDELPPGLRKFVPLLNLSTADIGPPQLFDAPPTIDSIQLDAAAGEEIDEEPTVKRAPIEVSRALAMRFAIDNRGATLGELMLLLSQLTGVAVEVELISLDLAGVSTTATLETPAGWMSVGQWLDRSLAPLGLAAEVLDQRVLIYATPQKLAQAGSAALRLDDFGDSAAQVAQWMQPVASPVAAGPVAAGPVAAGPGAAGPGAAGPLAEEGADEAENAADRPAAEPTAAGADEPAEQQVEPPAAAWEYVAAEQRLAVPLDRAALVRALLTVEAARRLHGLPGRLPRWQTVRWMGVWTPEPAGDAEQPQQPADAISDWPLVTEGSSGPTLDSPRTHAGLLRQLAADNGVAIIVAWGDALRHQFYPADLAMPYTDKLPAGAVLDELIGEAGLQARDTGGSVWWIGSEANYDRYEVISWLTIPAGSGEATARRLAQALGVAEPTGLPVAWNETTLLVRAPRYIARQLNRFVQP